MSSSDLAVVTWLWDGGRGYRSSHVETVARMFKRHLPVSHRFVCITDDVKSIPGVEVVPMPAAALELSSLRNPEGGRFPSCYQRLWMFTDEAKMIADRVLCVDIDILIVQNVTPLIERDEDFVGWRPTAVWGHGFERIGGGIYLLRTGTHNHVRDRFTGARSIAEAREAGYRGSDQAWMSYVLQGCAIYGPEAGIYSIRDFKGGRRQPPSDARLIQHNGTRKPWTTTVPWVRRVWRQNSSSAGR